MKKKKINLSIKKLIILILIIILELVCIIFVLKNITSLTSTVNKSEKIDISEISYDEDEEEVAQLLIEIANVFSENLHDVKVNIFSSNSTREGEYSVIGYYTLDDFDVAGIYVRVNLNKDCTLKSILSYSNKC